MHSFQENIQGEQWAFWSTLFDGTALFNTIYKKIFIQLKKITNWDLEWKLTDGSQRAKRNTKFKLPVIFRFMTNIPFLKNQFFFSNSGNLKTEISNKLARTTVHYRAGNIRTLYMFGFVRIPICNGHVMGQTSNRENSFHLPTKFKS